MPFLGRWIPSLKDYAMKNYNKNLRTLSLEMSREVLVAMTDNPKVKMLADSSVHLNPREIVEALLDYAQSACCDPAAPSAKSLAVAIEPGSELIVMTKDLHDIGKFIIQDIQTRFCFYRITHFVAFPFCYYIFVVEIITPSGQGSFRRGGKSL